MIVGVGTDIIEIARIEKALETKRFLAKLFSSDEIKFFNSKKIETIAGSFAAKEAVSKALGTGFRGFGPQHIEILRDAIGKPYVFLSGGAQQRAVALDISCIHISISHSDNYAIAFAVAEGGPV